MNRQHVSSAALRSVGYEDGTLEVQLYNGDIHQYFEVPKQVCFDLMVSSSLGRYFTATSKTTIVIGKSTKQRIKSIPGACLAALSVGLPDRWRSAKRERLLQPPNLPIIG